MLKLTVGYVASLIAVGVIVNNDRNIASRVLQRTWWPTILASDSVLTHGARLKITLISWFVPTVAVLIAIAGIVTPLGLYEQFDTLDTEVGSFVYVKDSSSFGTATSQRGLHDFSRACSLSTRGSNYWNRTAISCPSLKDSGLSSNSSNGMLNVSAIDGQNFKIAPVLREIFSSGTRDRTTVSNFFDIEWRQVTVHLDPIAETRNEIPVGFYRQLESHIMDPSIRVVEGLVVDGGAGGIGLRNHTVPANAGQGASWSEDLLFIEPIASCVNTNLTLDFEISLNASSYTNSIKGLRLVDRGGFVNMNKTAPYYDHDNAQANPDLYARAYSTAYRNNRLTMLYFNVTSRNNESSVQGAWPYLDSELGKEFPLENRGLANYHYQTLSLSSRFGEFLDIDDFGFELANKTAKWPNPFNVTNDEFNDLGLYCSGAGGADLANISNIYVACGVLKGAARRVDSGPGALFENHSKWSSPIYICATTVKAAVKTVNFMFNGTSGTNGLEGLKATSVAAKRYSSPEKVPLWGIEDSGSLLRDFNPIWGLVSPEYVSSPNISTVRQTSFHLPGSNVWGEGLGHNQYTSQNMPASTFAIEAMDRIFSLYGPLAIGSFGENWPFDLRGAANMPIFNRWQALSNDSERISEVIKLAWTDIAASAVVGTKGTLGPGNNAAADKTVTVLIKRMGKQVKYRWVFGIPAFFLMLVMLVITVFMMLCAAFQPSSIAVLRRRLQQLTVGRVLTTFLYPEDSNLFVSSKEWSRSNGHKAVSFGSVPRKGFVCEVASQSFRHRPKTPIENVVVSLMGGDGKPRN
ncbi:hypothetical protein CI238_13111 [Colletotrichum incanum]|uniref:Uncharacterized protein n=1 Tax=Colletotrichum incanum TaxID=1573173 RepID=A0A162PM83_COLIC|nr:hypothetical protein CI238_13111 [Colletotrichum incanum]